MCVCLSLSLCLSLPLPLPGYSKYDPSDILSNRTCCVRTALKNLYSTPQNNFRVTVNGEHIYGGDRSDVGDKRKSNMVLCDFFGVSNGEECERNNVMEDMGDGDKDADIEGGEEVTEGEIEDEEKKGEGKEGEGNEGEEVKKGEGVKEEEKKNNRTKGEEGESAGVSSLLDALSSILRSEDVLHRVRRFQTLDLLDVEGMI
jgi:Inositol-pentakisphosphate 2-kinase